VTTLADALRMLMTAEDVLEKLDPKTVWNDDMAKLYLRGHDDRQSEIDALHAHIVAQADREQQLEKQRNAAQDRVRELEATLLDEHSRLAQAQAQPAAVGVVGSVRWGRMYTQAGFANQLMMGTFANRADAEKILSVPHRVVAIVDPDAIVPLASAKVVGVISPSGSLFGRDKLNAAGWSDCAPVYPGIAQPAQEREG
jgi:hypothetical protein